VQLIFSTCSYSIPHWYRGHGGGEKFFLTKTNNYTFQIPWFAYSRLHLKLQVNDTVELYVDDKYICDCTRHDFVIEPSKEALIMLKSSSSVSGMFIAQQEIPLEKQILASSLLLIGFVGAIIVLIIRGKSNRFILGGLSDSF